LREPVTPEPAPAPAAAVSPATVPPAPGSPELPAARAATPVQTPGPDDEAEPTSEEQARWTEGERTLHGALVKERQKRKEARQESASLRDRLAALEARVPAEPAAGAPPPPAAPIPIPQSIAECQTIEQIEARVAQANANQAKVLHLNTLLSLNQTDAVVEALKADGVKELNGAPLEDAEPAALSGLLAKAYEGCLMTQTAAEPHKRYLLGQAQSMVEATRLIPELKDPTSARARKFVAIVHTNPLVRQMGAHWPQLVARQVLGEESESRLTTATATAPPAPPAPPTRPLPGAPRTSVPALPHTSEADAAQARIKAGAGTMEDLKLVSRAALRAAAV
jgi:hypothetical protein